MTMFPDPPYAGFTWPITQHMGVITAKNLYQILWAAAVYCSTDDPPLNITNYVIANNLFTPNIRSDSGQPDAWRDYQQILSELGLIVSTQVISRITPTPIGLAYLDGSLSFSELMTLQALRYQYPNGHKRIIDPGLRRSLAGSGLEQTPNLFELHQVSGVQVRPGVLVWSVIRHLNSMQQDPFLSVDEIQEYLMRCSTNKEAEECAQAITSARHGGPALAKMPRGRRNVQDWIKFLSYTPLFEIRSGTNGGIALSDYGHEHASAIDEVCTRLESPSTFWADAVRLPRNRLNWYIEYGTIDIEVGLESDLAMHFGSQSDDEYQGGQEGDDIRGIVPQFLSSISLNEFDPATLGGSTTVTTTSPTIESSYDSGLTQRAHRLHDEMILLIANTCRSRGASIFDDKRSVDLLAEFEGIEYIIEVKSVTPRNLVGRLRYAIGQVLHYEYLLSNSYAAQRRKAVAVPAAVSPTSWVVPFFNDHLDMDFISLDGSVLRVDSPYENSRRLFSPG